LILAASVASAGVLFAAAPPAPHSAWREYGGASESAQTYLREIFMIGMRSRGSFLLQSIAVSWLALADHEDLP
jgi:hypothetical protein